MICRALTLASAIVLATSVGVASQTRSDPQARPGPRPPVPQPTDPCEVVNCAMPSNAQQRLWVRLGFKGDTAESRRDAFFQLASLPRAERARLEDPVPVPTPTELARLRACSAVVKKYRPRPDQPVDARYETEYLDTCFHTVAEVPAEIGNGLRRAVVRLTGPRDEPCTGVLLTDRAALTARHCFQGSGERAGAPLTPARLEATTIHGSDASGTMWRRQGVRLLVDGASDRSAPLDIVVVGLRQSEAAVPAPPRVRLLELSEAQQRVGAKQSLLLASFPYGYEELRIDDFASCIARSVRGPFIVHHCQSLQGSSGAPLFVRLVDQPFTLGGVHVGAAGTVSGHRSSGQNEAAMLSASFISAIRAAGITP